MIKSHHKKIAIIGNAGSGKTTLAFKLHKKLGLPLYHLDHYYWLPNWQRIGLEKFKERHSQLCEQDVWIMEGIYTKTVLHRVVHADVVIFLDMPRYVCMWYVLKRAVLHRGTVISGSPDGCEQQLFSLKFCEFLRWVWNFYKRDRLVIANILDEFKTEKLIYILKSPQEVTDFVQKLEK